MNSNTNNFCNLILAASNTNFRYTKKIKKEFLYLNSGSSLAIEKIAYFYNNQKIPIYVVIHKEEMIPQFRAFENCNFIKISKTKSIIETLRIAIYEINKLKYKNILINPIQVIPSDNLADNSISISKSLFRKGDWTAVNIKNNKIEFIFRDDKLKQGKLSYAFTGRINANISHIKKFLESSKSLKSNDLGYLASYLFINYNYKLQHETWYDLTHDALLTETKLKSIKTRHFHSITYCKEKNAITKNHTNKKLFLNTVEYYKKLNNKENIRRFFPSLLEVKIEKKISSYTLEYIPFPTLGELFLHESLDHHIWERIIQNLKNIYDQIYSDSSGISGINSRDFFSIKLLKREELLKKLFLKMKYSNLEKIYKKNYKVNSIKMPSLKKTFKKLSKILVKFENNSKIWFGHGDFCFNNILIDPYSLTTKLIDPKAINSLGEKYIGFVPRNYDLAKLNHSFICLYDSIISNMYTIDLIDDNNYKLNIFHPDKYLFTKEIFEDIFFEEHENLKSDINIITANLFLSMLPLHSDDPKRMVALAIVGNAIFESYESFSSKIFK